MKVVSIFFTLKGSTIEIPFKEEYSPYKKGDLLIFKTDEFKEEVGKLQREEYSTRKSTKIDLSGEILRHVTERDLQKIEVNQSKETALKDDFFQSVEKLDLDMHIVSAHFSFDGSLIYIIFMSESRVDFRDLVKSLAQKFQKKIHFQQIGPRDKSSIKGGYGLCGQEFCCKKFLPKIPSVTMESVRVQNMAYKGTEKLSGQCGKLMCCLNYETAQYRELIEKFPKFGNEVTYKKKKGNVVGLDVLNEKIKIKFDNNNIKIVPLNELEKNL